MPEVSPSPQIDTPQLISSFKDLRGRVGILGGTFDPVVGHLELAREVLKHHNLDSVVFVPTAQNPLKAYRPLATDEQRVQMLLAGVQDEPRFKVCTADLRAGKRYTVELLEQARREVDPEAQLFFIAGVDNARTFEQWKNPQQICELASVVFVSRPGSQALEVPLILNPQKREEVKKNAITTATIPSSASEFRALMKSGESTRALALLPAPVREVVINQNLYCAEPHTEAPTALSIRPQQPDFPIEKLGVIQFDPITGDIEGNTRRLRDQIRELRSQGAEVIVAPEAAITGYCHGDLVTYDDFVLANLQAINLLAQEAHGCVIVCGFIDVDPEFRNPDGTLAKFNAAAVLAEGKVAHIHHKLNLPTYGRFDDKRHFKAGEQVEPIRVTIGERKVTLGVLVCEDLWDQHYHNKAARTLADKGAEILISINASPAEVGKSEVREQLIRSHVAETGLPLIYVNTVGIGDIGKNIIPFDGESVVFDRYGRCRYRANRFSAEHKLVELNSQPDQVEPLLRSRSSELYDATAAGLREYAHQSGFSQCVIPVSGGVDSALGLALCVEAFGSENVLAYNLPSKFNSKTTRDYASVLCQNFGVELRSIPIQKLVDHTIEQYEAVSGPLRDKVALENLQARERGVLMMLESNSSRRLLVSCGNKTEIALGYSTLYGDMCGGISVIGDWSKIDVFNGCAHVNERLHREMIPQEIFTSLVPSAELSEGQVDPFDYYVTSPLIDEFIVSRRTPRAVIEAFKAQTLEWPLDPHGRSVYEKLNYGQFADIAYRSFSTMKNAVYKRLQGAPIITVTPAAYGFVFREPLISRWRGDFPDLSALLEEQ